jgi:hypothetical protein
MKKEKYNIDSFESFDDLIQNLEVKEAPKGFTAKTMRKFDQKLAVQSSLSYSKVLWFYGIFLGSLASVIYFLKDSLVTVNSDFGLSNYINMPDVDTNSIYLSMAGVLLALFVFFVDNYSNYETKFIDSITK